MNLGLKGEDAIQAEIIQWARKEELTRKELSLLFHPPNGGARNPVVGMKFKALGVRRGVPDLCLDVARGGFFGLRLEIKDGDKGRLSEDQKLWHAALQQQGYCVGVIRNAEEGKNALLAYLQLPKTRVVVE